MPRLLWIIVGCFAVSSDAAADSVDYVREIKPLLTAKCAACHGALKQQSGLRLDAAQLIKAGGESGPVVLPGDVRGSLLWQHVTAADGASRMPPEGEGEHLTAAQLELIKAWIEQGAATPVEEPVPSDPRQYWSYQSPRRPAVPAVEHAAWVRTPIDAFLAAALEREGLAPRLEAPREVWLRRVYLDLVGLPPTRDELHAFLADDGPGADERVVDDLLQRPAYGERWGRHWMDVWRYSDWYGSRGGNEIRYSQRHIWRWRDWIVESLNADRPYDRMIVEMLAGDEVAPLDPGVQRATGFLGRNWYKFDRNVWLFETVEQTGQAFLGLTFKCARCHDHKFDPITQVEYYRFRAFFEPHDVRTDALRPGTPTEKDATLGNVLKDGVARVFDKDLNAKTYLFQRGDSRYPDERQPLEPGVPQALGQQEIAVEPVALPAEAYYPLLRPAFAADVVARAETSVAAARQAVGSAHAAVRQAEEALAAWSPPDDPAVSTPFLIDDFAAARPDVWKATSGDWQWTDGKLVLKTVGQFATMSTLANHPRDFQAKVRYRTLAAGLYRSVGLSFDQNGPGESQDVYTSVNDSAPSVQAFHRQGGKQEYPAAGIVKTPLKVEEEITLEVTVRGAALSIRVNGEPKLDYVMPLPRREGKFALWVHSGTAEFLEVEVRGLVPTIDDLRRAVQTARAELALAERKVLTAEADALAVGARLDADRAKHGGESAAIVEQKARAAHRAEKLALAAKAAEAVLLAEQHLASLSAVRPSSGTNESPPAAIQQAREKLATATDAHAAALAAAEAPGESYQPLGDHFPATSTGRRLALGRWMTRPDHPRTSRVAVNHIWLRHFGQAVVPSVANFGLNGDRPTHPELLDWLATEFVQQGWRMKPLHRMMVLSAAYRQSSSDLAAPAWPSANDPLQSDPQNRWMWRRNSSRMEAEVVRDAVLATSGLLQRTPGGPEIPETEGQTNFRRSLYFRLTPNEKMAFLETFDAADPNGCYRRKESVVPHQALALMNSRLAMDSARTIAEALSQPLDDRDDEAARTAFITAAFEQVLTRRPTTAETHACLDFLSRNGQLVQQTELSLFPAGGQGGRRPSERPTQRARENLIHVLLNHNDFVTIR